MQLYGSWKSLLRALSPRDRLPTWGGLGGRLGQKVVLAILLSLMGSVFPGKPAEPPLASPESRPGPSFILPTHLDDIYFYVQAHIGGVGPFNLVLDSGASFSVASPKVAQNLRDAGVLRDVRD